MSATLHVIQEVSLHAIPGKLRELAGHLERGEWGHVTECVVVTSGDSLNVFGYGGADGTVAHYLLCCGARRLEEPRL